MFCIAKCITFENLEIPVKPMMSKDVQKASETPLKRLQNASEMPLKHLQNKMPQKHLRNASQILIIL